MFFLHPGLYVRVVELVKGPEPLPLCSGFNEYSVYLALGLYNRSESREAYFIFSNDRDEVWFG